MISVNTEKTYIYKGREVLPFHGGREALAFASEHGIAPQTDFARETMAYSVLSSHNSSKDEGKLCIKFDALASHDITYVGIIQTARASGLTEFPVPYALTNCHNSLCAVGGTLNEDDHVFGLSAAKKYGGIFVPPHIAVIHSYAREMLAGCGKMILGSDSHTRYGALGCMAIGEGGPELVKQLLCKTYDIDYPEVVAVMLKGKPRPGVGPHDVAIALVKAVFASGAVKNKVLEFIGEGVHNLSVDYRCGIDVMTTETTCLSSIWETDDRVRQYYAVHGRPEAYCEMKPGELACYDGLVTVELSEIEPMIALPFHPSNAYTIKEFKENAEDLLAAVEKETDRQYGKNGIKSDLRSKIRNGRVYADQGVIAGCAGGIFENIMAASDVLRGESVGDGEFALNVYPASQSVYYEIINNGAAAELMAAGAVLKTAFCGPCFGAGDVPANNAFSLRHTTRNFPNREGSKPGDGQISYCALMDARSIAATAARHGEITAATETETEYGEYPYTFHDELYKKRVYNGWGHPQPEQELVLGPNIANWPALLPMPENLLLRACCVIRDEVTTTDELIPSGETSTLRSNPYKLSDYALSRKDPTYVPRAKAARAQEEKRRAGKALDSDYAEALEAAGKDFAGSYAIGSFIYANMPGDGSAREQAASCQKVLGGWANIAVDYATKRYRSNLINWGLVPLHISPEEALLIREDDFLILPGIRSAIAQKTDALTGYIVRPEGRIPLKLTIKPMTEAERAILTSGGLINYYADHK